jgi:hypothetical protein
MYGWSLSNRYVCQIENNVNQDGHAMISAHVHVRQDRIWEQVGDVCFNFVGNQRYCQTVTQCSTGEQCVGGLCQAGM